MAPAKEAKSDLKRDADRIFEDLKQRRDEIELRIHLAAADARDEWGELEKKWQRFRGRVEQIGKVAGGAAEDVGEAVEMVGEELKRGYERIRKML